MSAGRRALEAKVDVESLEELQAQRRALIATMAGLKALHGPFGLFDDRRKQLLEAIKLRVRDALTVAAGGKKPTEDHISAAAYADPAYVVCLSNALAEKIDYIRQSVLLSEIEERIRSRELELSAYTAEARLTR